ncbi:type II secretion system protein [Cohnella endophytica]|uniref:Type II secretion system protein n=1 Tax=Cohnella endophytica TaxID=2419778 RepID=A0A494YA64_9BACL|nr:type II secretion system protein [Cohnella endophytica]RKP57218.1 type II secretion system protein [Cohnella endophytica]
MFRRVRAAFGIRDEEGFTLLEILGAITILSVASLAMTGFFVNAMSHAKGNQNKTVVVNLARNALAFVEKQDFEQFKGYFSKHPSLTTMGCNKNGEGANSVTCIGKTDSVEATDSAALFNRIPYLLDVLSPSVNGRDYMLEVELETGMFPASDAADNVDLTKYLIPIKVVAASKETNGNKRDRTEVEGYISNEKIRKPIEG